MTPKNSVLQNFVKYLKKNKKINLIYLFAKFLNNLRNYKNSQISSSFYKTLLNFSFKKYYQLLLQNFKTLFFQLIIISTDFEKYYKINLALLFFKKILKTASKVATVTTHNLSYFLQTNT